MLTVKAAHQRAIDLGCQCEVCPLYGSKRGPVIPQTPRKTPKLLIVGESPTEADVRRGELMTGVSRREISKGLESGGLSLADAEVDSLILCSAPKGNLEKYLQREKVKAKSRGETIVSPVDCCAPHLDPKVENPNLPMILPLGKLPYTYIGKTLGYKIGDSKNAKPGEKRLGSLFDQRGHPVLLKENPKPRHMICSVPPSFAARKNRAYAHVIRADIARAAKISRLRKTSWVEPEGILAPSLDDLRKFVRDAIQFGDHIAVDIETDSLTWDARIRCVGLYTTFRKGGFEREFGIVVPFRRLNGKRYWRDKNETRIARDLVRELLDRKPNLYHNANFDSRHLIRCKLLSEFDASGNYRQHNDTMLAHSDTHENALPHRLSVVSSRFTEVPLWKAEVDHKATHYGAEADRVYWRYNLYDVATTYRCWPGLKRWLKKDGTVAQYKIDREMAPYVRNMSDLGMPMHMPTREKLAVSLENSTGKLKQEILHLTSQNGWENRSEKAEFNPNSFHHVRRFLYGIQGIEPVYATTGDFWDKHDEDQDPATSRDALLAILTDRPGIEPGVATFIDRLIKYKCQRQLLTTFARGFKNSIYPTPGLNPEEYQTLKVTFNQHVVPSGRLSASPNCLNVPAVATVNLRHMFQAYPGYVLISSDWDQLEARIYAVAAQDETLLAAFRSGKDIHSLNAATLFADSASQIDTLYDWIMQYKEYSGENAEGKANKAKVKFMRLTAKIFVFSLLYGAELPTILKQMKSMYNKITGERPFANLQEGTAKIWQDRWHRQHPETKIWQHRVWDHVYAKGWVSEPVHGRKRFFPGGLDKKNAPPNHQIQGHASGIANTAYLEVCQGIPYRKWGRFSGVINFVYDEILAMVPESHAIQAACIMRDAMVKKTDQITYTATPEITKIWTGPKVMDFAG